MRLAAAATVLTLLLAGCAFPTPRAETTPYYEEVIAGAPFTHLVIEVDHAPDHRPSQAALTHLESTFRNITAKTSVRVVVQETLDADPGRSWSGPDLIDLEKATRTSEHAAPEAVLHVLYPAGRWQDEGVGGVTISGPVIGPVVVFMDTLREVTTMVGPLPLPDGTVIVLERATLLHEAGHAIGLVNNGLPMITPREDADHPQHPTNPESVMYWQIETQDGIREMLLNDESIADEFDADDRADIRAVGGR